jgi:hypothetical protein
MSNNHRTTSYARLLGGINTILENYRRGAAREIQRRMESAYLKIGRRILEWERDSKKNPLEEERFLKALAEDLRTKAGGGISYETLKKLRKYSMENKAELRRDSYNDSRGL